MNNYKHTQPELDFEGIHYHNSLPVDEPERKVRNANANTQESLILELFYLKKCPLAYFHILAFYQDMDFSSGKRALTNLARPLKTKEGIVLRPALLVRTELRDINPDSGHSCSLYRLINE